MSTLAAKRFTEVMGMFYGHVRDRIPDVRHAETEKKKKDSLANSRHANSKKAVNTRTAKYSDSKVKRSTRKDMRDKGANVRGD